MRRVPPAQEPAALTAYRRSAERLPGEERHTVSYGALPEPVRSGLQSALFESQGGRCAYCDRGIRRRQEGDRAVYEMKIEHWAPQSENPELELVWSNLLAVCPGGEGAGEQHCDSRKGNRPLHLHPKRPDQPIRFRFRADVQNRARFPELSCLPPEVPAREQVIGTEITPRDPARTVRYGADGRVSGQDGDVEDDLDAILNLNAPALKAARYAAIKAVTGQIRHDWTAAEYERAITRALTAPLGVAPAWILGQILARRRQPK